ncbi:MAG: hypothetical protein CW691_03525 [Candidatus Bathyarchaeum sp.]|nr:MAG: hypothetical protein CW691_03525 [Candidatus Bathyarchaeum sp.]
MPELKFTKKLPDTVPSELTVYSTERVRYGQTAVKAMASKLKVSKRPALTEVLPRVRAKLEFRYVDNWTIGSKEGFTTAINRLSGAIRFRDEVRHGRELDVSFKVREPRIVEAARKYVDTTKLVKQKDSELKVSKITYLRTQGASLDGEAAPEQILDAGVIFTRDIDGVPVVGFGGYLMVNVAHDESVVAATKVWRHRDKKMGKVKVLQPDYAVKQLQKRLKAHGLKEQVNVLKSDFCYFEANDNTSQRYLEPTYAFLYETRIGKFLYKSVEVIPATQKPKQRWVFRKRFSTPTTTVRK